MYHPKIDCKSWLVLRWLALSLRMGQVPRTHCSQNTLPPCRVCWAVSQAQVGFSLYVSQSSTLSQGPGSCKETIFSMSSSLDLVTWLLLLPDFGFSTKKGERAPSFDQEGTTAWEEGKELCAGQALSSLHKVEWGQISLETLVVWWVYLTLKITSCPMKGFSISPS